MRYFIALFLLSISTFSSGQTELLDAKKLWARDSIRLGTNWIRSISKDTALLTVTDRDIPSAKAVKDFVLNRWNNGLLPWDNVTSKPSLLISGNNLADVSNVATARTNLSVYSIATVNDSLLNHFTKSQADARFKSIDWFPSVANVTGLPDSLTNLQARIQTKLTKTDADTYYPAIQRMQDSLAAVQARVQTKEPFISSGTTSQYWRGDKAWQTLDKSAVGLSAVPNVDATNPVNISQSATYRFVTDSEKSTWNAKQNALGYTPENISNKGIANGYADLDAGGKIPASRIDFGQTGQTFVVASQAAMLAVSSANIGALAVRTDESKNYRLIAQPASTLANWQVLLSPDAPVQSVNGFTGNVNLLTTHISEGSNYWWTAARSRAAQSLTTSGSSGAATYDNTSGILNIPTYTLSGLGGQPALSGTGFVKISGTTISYDNSTYLTSETDPTIYAWAKETTKPSYSWGEITGTVPTWNQNTTGNAATVTNGVYTTGSYANPAWISSLDYSKLTGTIPTWNQNTTGNAATATLAANSTLWNGLTISLSTYSSGTIPTFLGYNSSNSRVEFMPPSAMQSFLGLGSNAYTSTSFLPTSGGNLTGVTTVTNSYLTFNAASSQRGILGTYNYVIGGGSTDYSLGIFSEGDLFFAANGTATKKLTITTAGVNALVTLNGTVGSFSTSLTSNGVLYAYRAASDDLLEGGSIYFSGGYSSLRIGTDQSLNIDNYNGNSRINAIKILQSGATNFYSSVTAASFQKTGSSDSYFLLGGGGHVLASTYATTSSLSGYVDISNNQYEIGGNKTFLADVVVNGKLTGARILGSTASYTTTATISSTITTAFCSGSSYTLTLPSASGVTGQILNVISNSNLTGITLSGVEGGSYTLICNSSLVLVSNGTTWKIASNYQNSGACS